MEVRHVSLTGAPAGDSAVVALGFFDGVHTAHLALLRETVAVARKRGVRSAAFTFAEISTDAKNKAHLTTAEEREKRIADAGIDLLYVASFAELRDLAPADFVGFLRRVCSAAFAVCGFNFRFGKHAAGTPDDLVRLFDGQAVILPPLLAAGEPISTTRIRDLLETGEPEAAELLLGRAFSLTAPVVRGKGFGHVLGFPTGNQRFPEALVIPRRGVYRTRCTVDGTAYPAVTNVGVCPTVGGDGVTAESYLIGFSGDLYGKTVTTEFLSFLRPERKFPDEASLAAQIRADVATALSANAENIHCGSIYSANAEKGMK